MMRILTAILLMGMGVFFFDTQAVAASIEIRPAIYKNVSLKKSEKQKGYIDISNPTATIQEIKLGVKRFTQTDSQGSLKFFEDENIANGILLDLDNFELNPRDTIRVYFLLDAAKLPSGDIFAAIFARTIPPDGTVAQSVQVGTLLTIVNGTPTSRAATIDLALSRLQIGDGVNARVAIENTAPKGQATGYFPTLTMKIGPYSEKTIDGPLVFAGMSRTVEYRQAGSYVGFIKMTAEVGSETSSKWAFVITGYWRWVIIGVVIIGLILIFISRRYARLHISLNKQ